VLKEAALMQKPVMCEDNNSLIIANWLSPEFVFSDGTKASSTKMMGKHLAGINAHDSVYQQLYWTPRALAILEGSVARAVDPNFWVKTLDTSRSIVVSDWRFKSEYYALLDLVGKEFIRTVNIKRAANTSNDASERDLEGFDFDLVIDNTGTINQLEQALKAALIF